MNAEGCVQYLNFFIFVSFWSSKVLLLKHKAYIASVTADIPLPRPTPHSRPHPLPPPAHERPTYSFSLAVKQ